VNLISKLSIYVGLFFGVLVISFLVEGNMAVNNIMQEVSVSNSKLMDEQKTKMTQTLKKAKKAKAQSLINLLSSVSVDALISEDIETLDSLAKIALEDKEVVYIEIFDLDKNLLTSIQKPQKTEDTLILNKDIIDSTDTHYGTISVWIDTIKLNATIGKIVNDAKKLQQKNSLLLEEKGQDSIIEMTVIAVILSTILVITLVIILKKLVVNPLREVVDELEISSADIQILSTNLYDNATKMTQSSSITSNSILSITQTVNDSTQSMNNTSGSIKDVLNLGNSTQVIAKDSHKYVIELQSSMKNIADQSLKISSIVNTIDEIAFQTNLLALNAAVEAARAGENGLGFAVVAEEVKNLAIRSAKEASEISGIINSAVQETKDTEIITENTNQAFRDILEHISKTMELVDKVHSNSEEQTKNINSLNSEISSIRSETEAILTNSNQTEKSSQELENNVNKTKNIVNRVSNML
jgi:methyl-accepting chemotaxis protein/methyl-accepting chemotaxis protein-2 (aspartate sensor receptor)